MIGNDGTFVLHVSGERGQGHVKSHLVQIVEPHRLMCETRIAECAVYGVLALKDFSVGRMEGQCVDDF